VHSLGRLAGTNPIPREPMSRKRKSRQKIGAPMLSCLNLNAAGIDIGATEIYIAVPGDRDPEPVRCFATFTARASIHPPPVADSVSSVPRADRSLRSRNRAICGGVRVETGSAPRSRVPIQRRTKTQCLRRVQLADSSPPNLRSRFDQSARDPDPHRTDSFGGDRS
jgi:hypothetical protein